MAGLQEAQYEPGSDDKILRNLLGVTELTEKNISLLPAVSANDWCGCLGLSKLRRHYDLRKRNP